MPFDQNEIQAFNLRCFKRKKWMSLVVTITSICSQVVIKITP